MIQIKISPSERYSVSEMGQMAVEGGCGWIVVSMPGAEPGHWRDVSDELVPLCRDAGVMLSVDTDVAALRELGAHGVYLHLGANAMATRQDLGAEAIIGVEVASAQAAVALKAADVDYFTMPAITVDAQGIIADARNAGIELPFVAACPAAFFESNAEDCLACGFSGFYITEGVFETDDPVTFVEKLISKVNK